MYEEDKKRTPDYLREARLRAGYASRGTAAMAVPFSQETIGRHERGEVTMEPEDAIIYAKGYNAPELLVHYCADCPVGQCMGKNATERPLPFATLRVSRMIADGRSIADRLEEIAFDGTIDETERADFAKALTYLRTLEETIQDMLLLGCTAGIQNAGPDGNGTDIKRVDNTSYGFYHPGRALSSPKINFRRNIHG